MVNLREPGDLNRSYVLIPAAATEVSRNIRRIIVLS